MSNQDQDDWMTADTERAPPCSSRPPLPPNDARGVFRMDAQGEVSSRWGTLYEATREPPLTPEAEIRGIGGTLAMSDQDRAAWIFTPLGAERLEKELRGAA